MTKHKYRFAALVAFALAGNCGADVNYIWANTSSDMNSASSYFLADGETVSSAVPTKSDRIFFIGTPQAQPHLSSTLEVRAICFGPIGSNGRTNAPDLNTAEGAYDNCGWHITGEPGAELELPKSWDEGKNWNFAFSQASWGTNVVDVPVHFTSADAKLRPIMPSRGQLEFRKEVSSDSETATIYCSGTSGTVVFGAPNPTLRILDTEDACSVVFTDPAALTGLTTLILNDSTYPTRSGSFANESGEKVVFANAVEVKSTSNVAGMHFAGAPMDFPNAVFRPDLTKERYFYYFDVPVRFKGLENNGTTVGKAYRFPKYGAATLTIEKDIFKEAPAGQTNLVAIIDGTMNLLEPSYWSRQTILFGEGGYFFENGARPNMALYSDLDVPSGSVPGGHATWADRGYVFGWSAFGGNRTVRLFGGGILPLSGGESLSGIAWAPSPGWRQYPTRLVFGSPDADGTVTLDNDIDLYKSNSHWSANEAGVYAVKGKAFVDGRIKGCITNSLGAGLNCRYRKHGDGVIAFDGPYYPTSGNEHFVSGGGLLINAWCRNRWIVQDGAWLGGTGTVAVLEIKSGGGIRPGEQGGTLTSDGAVTMADGSKFIVDVDDNVHGCLKLAGASVALKANGTITAVPMLVNELTGGRTVKILDWQNVSSPKDSSLFDLANWTVDVDTNVFSRATLSIDGTAMYLSVRPKLKPGFALRVR